MLDRLPAVGIPWEAYTRANVIGAAEVVEKLEAAHCEWLLIGFESMSDKTLRDMDKRVSASQNERAFELLAPSRIALRTSFIVGFPGETPEEYEHTHQFIVERLSGRFGVHAFVLVDETMPVWKDAERHRLEVVDPITWSHAGMDSATAVTLRERTLTDARWKSEHAVLSLWQIGYERPLVPELDDRANMRIEKQIERLAFLVRDFGETPEAERRGRAAIDELRHLGITQSAPATAP
ncbi:radical SAM protein [Thiocapsa bogorovii]|uniref:radical SAM protein n=1 Tax=Thiocapsa bogorovii TaxID=521689 RepID=UPI002FC7C030